VTIGVLVSRTFARAEGAEVETLARVDFPIGPTPGVVVTFTDGAEAVVARVHVRLHDWAPGVYAAAVEVQAIPEPAEAAVVARDAGWTPARLPEAARV
jgi:hypothetical protein